MNVIKYPQCAVLMRCVEIILGLMNASVQVQGNFYMKAIVLVS